MDSTLFCKSECVDGENDEGRMGTYKYHARFYGQPSHTYFPKKEGLIAATHSGGFDSMRGKIYTIVSQINSLTLAQSNACLKGQVAEAIQCQKQYRHFVVVLLLAFCFMLSLETFKKSLGKRGESLTDTQVEVLRASMYKFANASFDRWQKKIKKPFVTQVREHKENGNCVTVYISGFLSMNVYA